MALDAKDMKILAELSKNCRMPHSKLARTVGLSQQVVNYRIARLVKDKVILGFITEMDLAQLGYNRHVTYVQFKQVDEKKEKEILDWFVAHPFITWILTSTGKWSVIFDIVARDVVHVRSIVDEITNIYGDYIAEYKIASQTEYSYFHSKYYGVNLLAFSKKNVSIDAVDRKILRILATNGRASYVELSMKLKMSANAIKKRIAGLKGIITAFTISPNVEKLGFELHNIQFTFENHSNDVQRFMAYIRAHPSVTFYYKPLGHWDLEIGVIVRNPGELRRIMLDFRNKFSETIKIYDSMLIYEELKGNVVPEGVFR